MGAVTSAGMDLISNPLGTIKGVVGGGSGGAAAPAAPAAPKGFNAAQYLKNNPDVAAAGMDALDHYNRYGKAEGRSFTAPKAPASKSGSGGGGGAAPKAKPITPGEAIRAGGERAGGLGARVAGVAQAGLTQARGRGSFTGPRGLSAMGDVVKSLLGMGGR